MQLNYRTELGSPGHRRRPRPDLSIGRFGSSRPSRCVQAAGQTLLRRSGPAKSTSDVIAGGSSKSMGHAQHSLCCQDTPCCGEPGRRNQHGKPHAARQCCTASQNVSKTKVYGLEICINPWTTGKNFKCLTGCTWCVARSPWVPARQINLVRARTGAQGLERNKCTITAVEQTTPLRFLTRVCMIAKTTPKVHTANTKQKPS